MAVQGRSGNNEQKIQILGGLMDEEQGLHDQVKHPDHYRQFGVEVIDIIRGVLRHPANKHLTGYEAYCMGNEIKYRLRAGFKKSPEQDIAKALQYYKMRSQIEEPCPLHQDLTDDIRAFLARFREDGE